MNRYSAFIKIIETGSFTKAAQELGIYAICCQPDGAFFRRRTLHHPHLAFTQRTQPFTPDAEEFLPYMKALHNSYRELLEKRREMQGLQTGIIRIGTFPVFPAIGCPI